MPSSLSHAMVAVALASAIAPREVLRPFVIIGAACAVLPDMDAVGRPFYGAAGDIEVLGGHRGFTHSLPCAVLLGGVVASLTLGSSRWNNCRRRLAAFVTLATASHGVLDAFTSIGAYSSPVQFFSPFSTRGYTAPWHPIRGALSELFLCLLPVLGITCALWYVRGLRWTGHKSEATESPFGSG
jgi:inner membrane protein